MLGKLSSRRRRLALLAGTSVLVEATAVWRRGYAVGGNVVVRCRRGHLFTTIWVPGASLKAIRLGWWRLQRCPVGRHWSLVTPVDRSRLTPQQERIAREQKDVRIP